MSKRNRMTGAIVVGAVVGATVALPFQALAELVYEGPRASSSLEGSSLTPAGAASEEISAPAARALGDRESMRQAVRASERMQATAAAAPQASVAAPAVVVAPSAPAPVAPPSVVTPSVGLMQNQILAAASLPAAAAPVAPLVEVEHVSRSELMRRERVRRELKNEDLLQQRLEELRLRDEIKRTEDLFPGSMAGSPQAGAVPPAPQAAPLGEESVSPQVEALPPAVTAPAAPKAAPVPASSVSVAPAATLVGETSSDERPVALSLAPRAGLSTMSGVAGLTIQSRYTAGLAFGVGVTDNLGFELGYSYSEFGVALASSNPWVYNFQAWTGTRESIALKQNVIDAGLKLHFLGTESRLRPFITAGGAYGKSFINYDARIIDALAQSGFSALARDYEVSSFLGYLGTGLDLRLSKTVSIGAQFKYFTVLSARENQGLNQAALSGFVPGGLGYAAPVVPSYGSLYGADMDKQVLGGTLARASFYSITAGVSFTF